MQASMVKNNPDVEPLIKEASDWEHTMLYTQEVIEIWQRVQTNYLFLVPIFSSSGIQDEVKNLLDHDGFKQIDKSWRDIMTKLSSRNRVIDLEREIPTLAEELRFQDERLASIQKNLNAYLESKREFFPRFYFLPNEDLIEILGDSQKPQLVQKHLKKLFEGISEVGFRDGIHLESRDQFLRE
jgi:dynein heavy chain, axonemal